MSAQPWALSSRCRSEPRHEAPEHRDHIAQALEPFDVVEEQKPTLASQVPGSPRPSPNPCRRRSPPRSSRSSSLPRRRSPSGRWPPRRARSQSRRRTPAKSLSPPRVQLGHSGDRRRATAPPGSRPRVRCARERSPSRSEGRAGAPMKEKVRWPTEPKHRRDYVVGILRRPVSAANHSVLSDGVDHLLRTSEFTEGWCRSGGAAPYVRRGSSRRCFPSSRGPGSLPPARWRRPHRRRHRPPSPAKKERPSASGPIQKAPERSHECHDPARPRIASMKKHRAPPVPAKAIPPAPWRTTPMASEPTVSAASEWKPSEPRSAQPPRSRDGPRWKAPARRSQRTRRCRSPSLRSRSSRTRWVSSFGAASTR